MRILALHYVLQGLRFECTAINDRFALAVLVETDLRSGADSRRHGALSSLGLVAT